MARFTADNETVAHEIIARYPRARSAIIPLLHLAQEQDGYVTDEAMVHIGELVGATPAEILGTCSFYEMFKRHEVGKYVVNVCTNISCQLLGGEDLLAAFEAELGVDSGSTTADKMFTVEDVECIAACTEAPACQINYRYFHGLDPAEVPALVRDLREGAYSDKIPQHGVLAFERQHLPAASVAAIRPPEQAVQPEWFARRQAPAPAAEGAK